jgi:uncharacterized protein YjbI with pentapeptide repeats
VDIRNSQRDIGNLIWSNVSFILAIFVAGGGLLRWLADKSSERRRREEERFEEIVKTLGEKEEVSRTGAAVLLPTFLGQDYERFYTQVFSLAVGHLRVQPSKSIDATESSSPVGELVAPQIGPVPSWKSLLRQVFKSDSKEIVIQSVPSPLNQVLVSVFRESYPLARSVLPRVSRRDRQPDTARWLNASGIQLDNAYLAAADLARAWMREASMRGAILRGANLAEANLERSTLTGIDLREADLSGANLIGTDLGRAKLRGAVLSGARLDNASLAGADLSGADLTGAVVSGVDFAGANLTGGSLRNSDFTAPGTNTMSWNLDRAESLRDTDIGGATGLTEDQIDECLRLGARSTTSP